MKLADKHYLPDMQSESEAPVSMIALKKGAIYAEVLSSEHLCEQTSVYQGTGAISQENRAQGFKPAFFDNETGAVYPSTYADGREAMIHLLDGLPDRVVVLRDEQGRILAVKSSVIPGFVKDGYYYTRDDVAALQKVKTAQN